ncbi:MAG: tetratricopeptide repeat protein [Pseudomonadota bacterium]|nr:tetratricopeptide repeat protein [Pseudomonadota bacterium]
MQLSRSKQGAAALLGILFFTFRFGLLSTACAEPAEPSDRSGVFADYLVGQHASSLDDPDAAAEAFLQALEATPSQPELIGQAFLASAIAGRPDAVGLARLLPADPSAQLLLANASALAKDWPAAERRLQGLPRDGLTQVLRPMLLAWAQQGAGHTDAALATLRRTDAALATLPPFADGEQFSPAYALHAGLIADQAGREQEAAAFYERAQARFGTSNLRLAQIIASFQDRHGQHAQALHTLSRAAETVPELGITLPGLVADLQHPPVATATEGMAEAYLAAAGTLQQQDQTDSAMLMLRFAFALHPGFTAGQVLAADILQQQHRPARAARALTRLPGNDPLIALVRLRQARLAQQTGKTLTALHEFEALAHDYPQSPLPYAQQAAILRKQGRFADAIGAYDQALARTGTASPASWPLFYDRGVAYELAQQWSRAEADFKRALALAPNEPVVLNYLGYSWADMGVHLAQARKMLETAADLAPTDGAIVDSLGWAMLRQGNTADAVRSLERAAELQPEDATVNAHLGDAYWAADRRLEASYQWQRALTLHPEPAYAEKLKAKLDDSLRQTAAAPAASGSVRRVP